MIEVNNLCHSFKVGKRGKEHDINVLKNVSFYIQQGEMATIVGKSGSGKSTLLHLLSGYLSPSSGMIGINETDVSRFNEREWAKFRLENIGFIFQNFQLISHLTTFANIELPLTIKGVDSDERKKLVSNMLEDVGLSNHADHYPNELSGGQQQRVSIARALITEPKVIFADEPTGSLDTETEQEILSLIHDLNTVKGITFLMITHDEEVARASHRRWKLKDGILQEEGVLHEV
ncbi:ABC transporter ATP-binding protein [Bacillus carboniphilus]|uniref:ABC transporter ATP-binding protein n=1 Tax=Bacillus carboniphilus TaxID=86663 RepID=A0ABY9JR26_9BACI|nr:ABC transporter ATP-binding protein [Bacillus carboniphilus]WLR41168.1 ABC transporter ATP-binding protein [Bacillus carboniphilus]